MNTVVGVVIIMALLVALYFVMRPSRSSSRTSYRVNQSVSGSGNAVGRTMRMTGVKTIAFKGVKGDLTTKKSSQLGQGCVEVIGPLSYTCKNGRLVISADNSVTAYCGPGVELGSVAVRGSHYGNM